MNQTHCNCGRFARHHGYCRDCRPCWVAVLEWWQDKRRDWRIRRWVKSRGRFYAGVMNGGYMGGAA